MYAALERSGIALGAAFQLVRTLNLGEGEAMAELIPWVMEGKIKWKVHIDQGLDGAMDSLQRLFTGDHDGKLLIQVSPEP